MDEHRTPVSSGDEVSKAFSSRADQLRDEIRAAVCKVIEAVGASIAKKLYDIELASANLLHKKEENLKILEESVKAVVGFADCLRTRKLSHEEMRALLPSVGQGVDLLRPGWKPQAGFW